MNWPILIFLVSCSAVKIIYDLFQAISSSL
jgi:hypothetical protein